MDLAPDNPHPAMPSKLIAEGLSTGSEEARKLFSPNQSQTKSTVRIAGIEARITPSVGASATMWNSTEPWKRGGRRSFVRRRFIPQTMAASVTAMMLKGREMVDVRGDEVEFNCDGRHLVRSWLEI